jgi:hypothetical protein
MRRERRYPAGFWEEHKNRNYWITYKLRDLEQVLNNVHYGKYEDIFNLIKKWRDHPSNVCDEDGNWLHYPADYTDDECYGMAVAHLQSALEDKIKILKKVANLYRKNALEDMTVEDRWRFVRPNLKWHGWVSEHTYQHLVEYPPHLLHVQRFKKAKQWSSSI